MATTVIIGNNTIIEMMVSDSEIVQKGKRTSKTPRIFVVVASLSQKTFFIFCKNIALHAIHNIYTVIKATFLHHMGFLRRHSGLLSLKSYGQIYSHFL